MPHRILILCTGNCVRSQIAEGVLRRLGGEAYEVRSAGSKPNGYVSPLCSPVLSYSIGAFGTLGTPPDLMKKSSPSSAASGTSLLRDFGNFWPILFWLKGPQQKSPDLLHVSAKETKASAQGER